MSNKIKIQLINLYCYFFNIKYVTLHKRNKLLICSFNLSKVLETDLCQTCHCKIINKNSEILKKAEYLIFPHK